MKITYINLITETEDHAAGGSVTVASEDGKQWVNVAIPEQMAREIQKTLANHASRTLEGILK